uniref:Uncharacterized protein AlNc14C37G3271 n=1 Tax=Albugo laibachii Nc14 TaxID=890382 RepID=F0W901_9STRA|nr:conserved hypothetical protein [Albugo laibachii Nc14]|eukprot:CCA17612.1 conserved hypothetical protein [Albugo laibachii Nc14]
MESEGRNGTLFVIDGKGGEQVTALHHFQAEKVSGMAGNYGSIGILTQPSAVFWVVRHEDHHYEVAENIEMQQIAFGKSHVLLLSHGKIYSSGSAHKALLSTQRIRSLGKVRAKTQAIIDLQNKTQESLMKCITEKFTCKFIKIAAGTHHSAAITENGELYTWGRNFEGQLGHGIPKLHLDHTVGIGFCAWPKYVQAFYTRPAVQDVCCGDAFTVVLLRSGVVYRFGEHMTGRAKDIKEENSSGICILIEKGSDGAPFCKIAAGSNHALLMTQNGEAFATGFNTSGQLGVCHDRVPVATLEAVRVDSTQTWKEVCAGENTSAAISDDGNVYLWGSHSFNEANGRQENRFCSQNWRCTPTPVKGLQSTSISHVLCGLNGVLLFAPSRVMSLEPDSGDIDGGYELIIHGSGFSSSENLTCRFIPLTEGRLVRGSVARFNAASNTIRCQVPKFKLPGQFAVEIAMNGKDFTTNGCVFEAFETPKVVAVSIRETNISEPERFWIKVEGDIPRRFLPLLRFASCEKLGQGWPHSFDLVGDVHRMEEETGTADQQVEIHIILPDLRDVLRGKSLSPGMPYKFEVSYNNGAHFQPVLRTESLVSHSIYMHHTTIERITPNSFVLSLSQEFDVLLSHYDPVMECISAEIRCREDECKIPLRIDRVEHATLKCSLTEMEEWDIPSADGERWIELWRQKGTQCLPFDVHIAVGNRHVSLPAGSTPSSTVYGVLSTGSTQTLKPNCGLFTGGTSVRMYSEAFQFTTDNAKIAIAVDENRIEIEAVCVLEADPLGTANDLSTHCVIFDMPATSIDSEDSTGKKEALVSVALDGQHYTDTNVIFTYYNPPLLLSLEPRKVTIGTKVTLSIASELAPTETARVRLTSDTSDLCVVVLIAVETSGSVSFFMPEIPNWSSTANVLVAFALNGQQFVAIKEAVTTGTTKGKASLNEKSLQAQNELNEAQAILIYEP